MKTAAEKFQGSPPTVNQAMENIYKAQNLEKRTDYKTVKLSNFAGYLVLRSAEQI